MSIHKFRNWSTRPGDIPGSHLADYTVHLDDSKIECEEGDQYEFIHTVSEFRKTDSGWQVRSQKIALFSAPLVPIVQFWKESLASHESDPKIKATLLTQIAEGPKWNPATPEQVECIEGAIAMEAGQKS